MLTEKITVFVEGIQLAFVASTDREGRPHLAAGKDLKVLDTEHLVFENWFCSTTLRNVAHNPRVAVVVTEPATGNGFQFLGKVTRTTDAALLDGYIPDAEPAEIPQTLTRFVVQVTQILPFSAGIHSDAPLEPH